MAYPDSYEECTMIDPITSIDVAPIDYDRIQAMLNSSKEDICECSVQTTTQITEKLVSVEGGIKQIIGNVVDEINENESYFKETGFRIII